MSLEPSVLSPVTKPASIVSAPLVSSARIVDGGGGPAARDFRPASIARGPGLDAGLELFFLSTSGKRFGDLS
ncbi:hypothetical protein B0T26DRAFT_699896 [Lasiosphaeria miniovina]|uniref:Uncharacterized protein n=1 Tax=Lasiosphaeria miniovina TaxID=1954250 RepID=A0AA40E2B3_9PEZI|nr:uncharacterized protein B0T26DRAFT_699896 [Lasiosphaeria miniovina]KAK0721641.1 hypothetical protein B0T26DRAFT_699896 [Lasiosphaeria miniovina]